jgi:CBS domain-containing protein
MESRGIRHLPVVDQGRLVGVVTQSDLTRALTSCHALQDIGEIMCRDVATVPPEETVQTAVDVMAAYRISSVVVVESGQVKGVLTERDVLKKVAALERDAATIPVTEIMSSPVFSAPSNYSAFCAGRMMDQTHVHRLVVLDDDRLVGIVTQTDIFRAAQRRLQAGEERALRLLDCSKTSVYVLDPEGRIVYLNPAFADLMEIDDPVSLIDQPFLEDRFWVVPQARPAFMETLRQGDVQIDNLHLKTAHGNPLCIDVVSGFLRDVHGRVSAIHGVCHNVTGQRLAEEASTLACKQLEQVNRELTQVRTQIGQGEKLALIGQWADGVVQDLNRPLGRLSRNLEAIRKYNCFLCEFVALSDELMALVEPMERPDLKAKLAGIQDSRRIMKTGFILEDVKSLCDESKEEIEEVVKIVRNLQHVSRTDTGDRPYD